MWDLSRVKEAQSYFGHKVDVTYIALSSDAQLAITFSWDGDMRVWNLEKFEEQKSLSMYKGLLKCISLFPDGQRGIGALSDKSLRIWDIYSAKELRCIKLNTYAPPDFKSIKISPDSNYAIATFDEEGVDEGGASRVRGVYKFDLNKGDFIKPQILIDDDGYYSGNRISYYGNPIDFTSDGNYVIAASGFWASNLSVWSFENPSMGYDIIKDRINSIVPVPNSNYILTSFVPNEIKIWDIHNKRIIRDISLRTDGIHAVAIAANGERAVSADKLNQVNLWNFKTGGILARFSAESNITACLITPDGKTIIAGEESGRIHILKLEEMPK
jgi:WD40 repeat protein